MELTAKQLDMAIHCLGLNYNPRHKRNYYCINEGEKGFDDWEDMVEKGYAGTFERFGNTYFFILPDYESVIVEKSKE
jgi:hypothetical protein